MQGKLKDILKLMVHYYTIDISKVIGVMLKYFKMGDGEFNSKNIHFVKSCIIYVALQKFKISTYLCLRLLYFFVNFHYLQTYNRWRHWRSHGDNNHDRRDGIQEMALCYVTHASESG